MTFLQEVTKLANEILNTEYTITDYNGNKKVLSANGIGYRFEFRNTKRIFGSCWYSKKVISLSKPLCLTNPNQLHGKIKDTILHEIAHAFTVHIFGLKEGKGHGHLWVNISKQIGADGKRCYSLNDFGGITPVKGKYYGECPSCKNATNFHRKPKRTYSCGKCSPGKFNKDYALILKENY